MEFEFKIDKGVELPNPKRSMKYPFEKMTIGDSFIAGEYSRDNMAKFGNAARNWAANFDNKRKFAMRKTDDNMIRLWRTE